MCAESHAGRTSDSPVLPDALRRGLMRRANRLEACVTIGKRGVDDAVTAQVRRLLGTTDLLKVRVHCDQGSEAEARGRTLCQRVPCQFMGRVGKTVILYRPPDEPLESQTSRDRRS